MADSSSTRASGTHASHSQRLESPGWGCWHAVQVMESGRAVVYVHFEEASPESTIARLRQLGVTDETLEDYFTWSATEAPFKPGRMAHLIEDLEPGLVSLYGINAACSQHGWDPNGTDGVGQYFATLVRPAMSAGAAVLSLGHPPKARDRQTERHGYGSTAWLDQADGVGFRMVASKTPIGRGRIGSSSLYSVKDATARWSGTAN